MPIPLAQNPGPNAATLFYVTLLIIFVTAIITTVLAKWSRDKCLKFFRGYRITMERARGATLWGRFKVFSSGVEIVYDHPYVDPHGRRKTSYLFYQIELEQQVLSLFRYHTQLPPQEQKLRKNQVHATFNPRLFRRFYRGLRNFVNTLRDAFNAAIGAAVTQYQRSNPVLSTQGTTVTSLGQTLLGKFANAYEPLLEQYIGQPVILEVADPLNPNNAVQEYTGYLADYTQQFIAVFNVDHAEGETISEIDGVVWRTGDGVDDRYSLWLADGVFFDMVDQTRFINHSCDPNAKVEASLTDDGRASATIIALRPIAIGEEVSYDYAFPASLAEPCRCGSPRCRGLIIDEDALPAANKRASG